ncbi:xanthine dehydrogenase family Fe-S subunit [Frigidibacter sp. ROC022]|uniref:xanthine dehydrogenase family Fe-S subunit n=1 Tax=Frigidibacter sp. ROC022 TaxID=2971796 RepID=UPI00215B4EEA|nr:2Fe-2S iron-sulfur cluster-binding protein [Frigidibacter sp. ROC022]MCR8726491.1 2Fe-2S iron-sulfur cluster-binding protein [Frigidibacter sp. ROC022]
MTETLSLTVNGEACKVAVTPRTQLAEVLRDHLDLTGTHLACEQGVCGACTVLMNGEPVRSCITYAQSCDGARIETIEGHRDDPVMDRLRAAFSRHHALQCGFCTPGMLATARDIITRFADPDEATIRHELSGNLCRCTGYVGIVEAIRDVIAQRNAEGLESARPAPAPVRPRGAFAPFQAVEESRTTPAPASTGKVGSDGSWTSIERSLTMAHPPEKVWALFRDIRAVAPCVPGAVIEDVSGSGFSGAMEIRFGPIRARFGGSGSFANDDADRSGTITGQGDDKNGRSKVRGELRYRVTPGQDADSSTVNVDLRFQLQGLLAQFNRPELVTDFADHILGQFDANCDAVLSGSQPAKARQLSGLGLGWTVLRSALRGLFRRK